VLDPCSLKYSSLYYVSKSSLNILWIIYFSSNSSWNVPWLMSFKILKGLYLFWSSFFEDQFNWIFLASNHILSPSFNSCRLCLFLSNCFFIASFVTLNNFFITFQLLCSSSRKSSSFDNSIFTVRFPFHEYLPKLSLNGVCSVATCFLSLY